MAKAPDFTNKPHAFHVVTPIPVADMFTLPYIVVHRFQFIPWNNPQDETHKEVISKNKLIADILPVDERFHDPDVGVIFNHIGYYNARRIPRFFQSSSPLPSEAKITGKYNLQDIAHRSWTMPTANELQAIRAKKNGVVIKAEEVFYALTCGPKGEVMPFAATRLCLIEEGKLVKTQSYQPGISGEIAQSSYMARDPLHGHMLITTSFTDSGRLFEMTAKGFREPSTGEVERVYTKTGQEIALGSLLHVFPSRPSKLEVAEARRRLGLLYDCGNA